MSEGIKVLSAGPGVTLQDRGRPGWLNAGLSRGGAADPQALSEGAALLGHSDDLPALEMAGMGGAFVAQTDLRLALTGAPMQVTLDGERLAWNASHHWPAGARLSVGGTVSGGYGYLHVGGGFMGHAQLGACSAHLSAGIGRAVQAGDVLAVRRDLGGPVGLALPVDDRFNGGSVRIVESLQTHLFAQNERERFTTTTFRRDTRGNRMGLRLVPPEGGFHIDSGRTILSEVIVPGDIQITGDGTPFVLLCECQTTGGYPRIGTVLPCDLPIVAQAPAGAPLRFRFVELDEATAAERKAASARQTLVKRLRPLIRDPHTIPDLLSYQLISGVTAGDDDTGEKEDKDGTVN
ncbi:allophanate hydrolase [Aliiroseovarius zhejiangensis]|uniref:Allophanate hydrolase n=1 Tax=Aliiroseovarius zhejiangensis TaxID=1632025 RepID=A0ABQ3IZ27_9RHOB|nr:urea amidolyase [Aliiroseovarius zhejiangensis]GHE98286.1 allophanate hydrolase [Aliiroseovarius zhejiangensis]